MIELVLFGKVGVERLLTVRHLRLHLGQPVIALRADNQIDHRLAAHDLFALGLGNTACHPDLQVGLGRLEAFEATEFGIHLFRRLFADVAGVQEDHVRVIGRSGLFISLTTQGLGHALAVIDIHLATIGLDKELLRAGHGICLSCWGSGGADSRA